MEKRDKLIRDKIPSILEKKRVPHEIEKVSGKELKEYVRKKILEEVQELLDFESIEEVVDVQEILKKFCEIMGFKEDEIERIRVNKNEERGSFENGIVLTKLGDEK